MNKKYDNDFFDDLDKTTDLLKAFKPLTGTENKNDLDSLFSEFNKPVSQVQSNLQSTRQSISEQKEFETYEKQYKDQISSIKKEQNDFNKISYTESSQMHNKQENLDDYDLIDDDLDVESIIEREQQKADLTQIIEKMNETVLEQKEEQKRKEQAKIEKKIQKDKLKQKEKKNAVFSSFEKVFCAFSVLFIIGCVFVYKTNMDKTKEETRKSVMLFTNAINKSSSLVYNGDGLYLDKGEYIYKGTNINNYVTFSNFTWRIIKTNNDGTIDLILDDYINSLKWNNELASYTESDVNKYLNEYFIKYIDTDYLEKTPICLDEVNDLKSFSCNEKSNDSYVRLLTLDEFYNSKNDGTYISNETTTLWLSTKSHDKVWLVNGLNSTMGEPTRMLGIKPVIKLKSGISLISGDGSKENPYRFTEKSNKVQVGDRVKLDNDVYIVYDIDDETLSLVSDFVAFNYGFSVKYSVFNYNDNPSVAYYLNNKYYNSLTYKDLLVSKKWYTGAYTNGYEDILSKGGYAMVGIPDVMNLKFNNDLSSYFLINGIGSESILYGSESSLVWINSHHDIRPAIAIKNNSIVSGDGSKENPYILER